jgi:hypothetical protein
MYNGRYVLIGLGVFALVFTYPFWANLGRASYAPPDLKYPKNEKECVLPKAEMRVKHMVILNEWRDWVVRDGQRDFVTSSGKSFRMSLTDGCMKCHDDKKEFCDKCHTPLAVSPYCWDCHIIPNQKGSM